MDEESEQIKTVYATYGLAMYMAQNLEKSISILLSYKKLENRNVFSSHYDYTLDEHFEKTFGALCKEMNSQGIAIPKEIENELRESLKVRNFLAHDYFWDNASNFVSSFGREQMIEELQGYYNLFENLDEYFTKINKQELKKRNITDEMLKKEMDKVLLGISPPKRERRLLRKKENLISIYKYYIDEKVSKYIPLFELDDHTLWTLSDKGFTYAPTELLESRKKGFLPYPDMLPAEIEPKPNNAKEWNYEIRLSTGYKIAVIRDMKAKNQSFGWKIEKWP